MFEYQLIVSRTNEMLAQAEHERLILAVRRANKARRAGEGRRTRRRPSAEALNPC